ncbi:MAG: hypothetical protein WC785_02690 [Tatlockia sp.]
MLEPKTVSNGIVAGVFSGVVLAFFILLGGMTETLGSLINMPNKLGGLLVHFLISIVAGVVFALSLGRPLHSFGYAFAAGLVFGLLMWLIGPLTLFAPITNHASFTALWNMTGVQSTLHSLFGYLLYGVSLGLSYGFLKKGKLHKLKRAKG